MCQKDGEMGLQEVEEGLAIVSAPSGAGKTTLNRRLARENAGIAITISHTTRKIRSQEEDGLHYYFVSKEEFEAQIKDGAFLEWAKVHGEFYGTSYKELSAIRELGKKPLLEIDVQGWLQTKSRVPNAASVFILPPSLKSLWNRLEKRGSDTLHKRWIRFKNGYEEIKQVADYKYSIINRDLDEAYQKLKGIIVDHKPHEDDFSHNYHDFCKELTREFHQADWINELRRQLDDRVNPSE